MDDYLVNLGYIYKGVFSLEMLEAPLNVLQLDFGDYCIEEFDEELFVYFCNIKNLTFTFTDDLSLPSSFFELDALETLHIQGACGSHKHFGMALLANMANLKDSLKELKLCNCDIDVLPPKFFNLDKLVTLSLKGNNIEKIASIKGLTSLQNLTLSFNNLTSLPYDIQDLTDLRFIDISSLSKDLLKQLTFCKAIEVIHCR